MKIIGAQQAKSINNYKNFKYKLLKTNAAIWYNKMYRSNQLTPKYTYINIQCNDSLEHAIKFSLKMTQ